MSSQNDTTKKEKRKDEAKMLNDLVNALLARTKIANSIGTIAKSEDYKIERAGLMSVNNTGLTNGIVATCVTFFLLRTGPKLIAKRLASRRSGGGYTLDPPPGTTGNPFQPTATNEPQQTVTATVLSLAKVLFDIYASLLVGALVSNLTLDETKLLPTLASIPLVEGRSFVADEFCKCVQDKIAQRPNTYWTQVDSIYLKQFKAFSDNCARRQAFEEKIRLDNGITVDTPVKIPMGGVPVDYTIKMDGQIATTDSNGFWNGQVDELSDEGQIEDDDWATDFVTGQDEQSKSS
jgi:hypothetical protein